MMAPTKRAIASTGSNTAAVESLDKTAPIIATSPKANRLNPMAIWDEPDRQKLIAVKVAAPHATTSEATNTICVVVAPPRDSRVKASDVAATISAMCATTLDAIPIEVPFNDDMLMISPDLKRKMPTPHQTEDFGRNTSNPRSGRRR